MNEDQMNEELGPDEATETSEEPGESGALTPDAVRSKMNIPPELKEPYDRVILAGMKVMFDKNTHQMALKSLEGPGAIEDKLALAITQLMMLLWKQSNQSMPPQLIFPCAIELMLRAVEFLNKSGEQVSKEQIGEAIRKLMATMMQSFGINQESLNKAAAAEQSKGGVIGQNMGQTQQPPMGG